MNKVRCPICQRALSGQGPKEWPDWPFCSPRCRTIDLGRWLGEAYRLPAAGPVEPAPEGGESPDPPKPAAPSAVPDREEA